MAEVAHTKVGEKGRLVIPAKFRETLGMQAGDTVSLEIIDGELKVSTFASRLKRAQEHVQKYTTPGKSLVDELIAGRREEARREEQQNHEPKKLTMKKHG